MASYRWKKEQGFYYTGNLVSGVWCPGIGSFENTDDLFAAVEDYVDAGAFESPAHAREQNRHAAVSCELFQHGRIGYETGGYDLGVRTYA